MHDILAYFGVGGFALMFLSVFFEISKIPLNPLSWLGKQLNKDVIKQINKIDDKLDAHVVSSYRNNILTFQEKLLFDDSVYTRERWRKVLNDCKEYEEYIKANDLTNGEIEEATKFIKASYQEALKAKRFKDVPQLEEEE